LRGRKKSQIKRITEELLKGYAWKPLTLVGVPCVLTKKPEEYKANAVQKKAFHFANTYLKSNFKVGDKPKRMYVQMVEGKEPIEVVEKVDVVAFDSDDLKLPVWLIIDWPRMMKQTVKPKIDKVLKFVDLEWKDIKLMTIYQKKKKKRKKKKKKKKVKKKGKKRKVRKNVRKISTPRTKRK